MLQLGHDLGVTPARCGPQFSRRMTIEEMLLEMHHIGRQLIAKIAIVLAPAADKDDGKAMLRVGLKDLVNPARHAAADIGESALEQQGDIGPRSLGKRTHEALQYWMQGRRRGMTC